RVGAIPEVRVLVEPAPGMVAGVKGSNRLAPDLRPGILHPRPASPAPAVGGPPLWPAATSVAGRPFLVPPRRSSGGSSIARCRRPSHRAPAPPHRLAVVVVGGLRALDT